MTVGIKLGSVVDEIGASSFLNAFFSTVAGLLENSNPGSVFPVIGIDFYNGKIDTDKLDQALNELQSIRSELMKFSPNAVIWSLEDRSKLPPWGKNISPEISSMANYFVTSTGKDMFEVFFEILDHAIKTQRSIEIVEI
jgi:hypothetical protein